MLGGILWGVIVATLDRACNYRRSFSSTGPRPLSILKVWIFFTEGRMHLGGFRCELNPIQANVLTRLQNR